MSTVYRVALLVVDIKIKAAFYSTRSLYYVGTFMRFSIRSLYYGGTFSLMSTNQMHLPVENYVLKYLFNFQLIKRFVKYENTAFEFLS